MVRFQPPSLHADADDGMDTSSSSGSDGEQRGRQSAGRRSRAAAAAAAAGDSDSSDDEVQLPLRGRTPNVKAAGARNEAARRAEQDSRAALAMEERRAAREEEELDYPRRTRPAGENPADAARRQAARAHASPARGKLQYMAETLMDEEEEEEEQRALAEEEEQRLMEEEAEAAAESLDRGVFAPPPTHTQRMQRPVPASALSNFLAALPRYVRPACASEYHRNNPLAPAPSSAPAATPAAAATRTVLDFHRHSFRAGWSSQGNMLVFAGGIDGRCIVQAHVDVLAVDANAQRDAGPVAAIEPVSSVRAPSLEAAASNVRAQKRRFIESCLETHLSFHSLGAPTPQQPSLSAPNGGLLSSARLFGSPDATASVAAPFGSSGAFSFGQASATPVLTPFTRLCDAYIGAIKSLLATQSQSQPSFAPSASTPSSSELELSLSAFQLLRSLYSKEEGEQRAPKLSRSMEAQLRAGTVAASGDLSVLTAQSDPYSLELGREAAFEQGWLRPTVASSYVSKRVRQLQSSGVAALKGSDGVSGSKLQEVLAHLIGHDVARATDACISIGDFRLATLVSQVGSFNSSGPLDADGHPTLQSSAEDLARQWSLWSSKDRGMGTFIPQDLHAIFRLLSGDVLIDSSLGWTEALALRYWYSQPQSLNASIARAMLNYKQHAFAPSQRVQVRKPYPAYASYVPVAERRGGVRAGAGAGAVAATGAQDGRGVLEDDDEDDDMDGAAGSQAVVLRSASGFGASAASAASGVEFYDIRYGLLDLYTQQARSVNLVLSPQSHVPHVLDHHIAWHIFTTMQFTPVSEFGPHLYAFYLNYIHQLELLSAEEGAASDLWKWAVYVALASPLPQAQAQAAEFDREKIVKAILMRHVSYERTNPFALPAVSPSSALLNPALALLPGGGVDSYAAAADKSKLPASLPILRADATGNFFSVSLSVDQSVSVSVATATVRAAASATESFLIGRLQLPVAWLHECKAVRALAAHDYAVACFHQLHAGDVTGAYGLWQERLRDPWILAVINRAEQGADREPEVPGVAALDSTLLQLLRYFNAHSHVLHGWSHSGALVLSYLEFRADFAKNVAHFTHSDGDLQDRAARIANFRQYRAELQNFLHTLDRLQGEGQAGAGSEAAAVAAVGAGVAEPALAVLAFSKMSGSILAHLHALQPLVQELAAEESRYGAGQEASQQAVDAAVQEAVDVSAGELVSSADRLAVLTDWKDSWLQQFNAGSVAVAAQ